MTDDEKIFGPLNLKQFYTCAAGFGAIYVSYRFLPLKFTIPIAIVAVVLIISTFINQPSIVFDENYIKSKRYSFKNREEYDRWLKRKTAEIQAQIYTRKTRGLIADPKLEDVLKLLESASKEVI
jgi:hypothetical protein